MKEIKLTKGYVALVDDADFERVNQFKWYAKECRSKNGVIKAVYAQRKNRVMHRFLLGVTDPDIEVDHKDHNGLNNQRYNIRKSAEGQNSKNRKVNKNNTSGFKGVYWHKQNNNWRAQIQYDGQKIMLGSFSDPMEAACAYDMAAVKYHGEFAHCNFAICD